MSHCITIIGGHGQMGQFFARQWREQGIAVHCIGRDDWAHAPGYITQSDAVIVSVPINVTTAVIEQLAPLLSPQSILADVTSIKQKPVTAMLAAHTGPVLGLHPMFGPTIKRAQDYTVVVCPGRDLPACQWLIDSITAMGFACPQLTAQQHDHCMTFVQGLEHFSTIALGSFMRKQQIDMDLLSTLASPIYQLKLQLLGRIFHQDAALYADIVRADDSRLKTIDAFLKHAETLLAQPREALMQEFEATAAWLGGFTAQAQEQTDALL